MTLAQLAPTPRSTPLVVVHVPPLGTLLSGALPAADADYGLVVEDVASGARVGMNERRVFPSASLYKLAVAWEVLRRADEGAMNLDEPLQITDEDAVEPEPYGGVASGQAPSLREALDAMLTVSSNAAAHALLRVLGRHEFNAAMGQLGLGDTRVPEDSAADDPQSDAQAVTSAADMAHLLSLIAHNQMLTAASHDDLMRLMASGGPPDALRDTLPDSVDVYDKTGNLPDASNVTALLQTGRGMVVLVVLDEGVNPGDARGVIAQLGQAAYDAVLR
ncbi:MAG: serine hydrolase [Chloroflexi bacterium]|nr:serine hydrolase [Chloroflexota bacterium]